MIYVVNAYLESTGNGDLNFGVQDNDGNNEPCVISEYESSKINGIDDEGKEVGMLEDNTYF